MNPNPIYTDNQQLLDFVNDIVTEKFSGEQLAPDIRQVIVDDTLQSLTEFIQVSLVQKLTPDYLDEFEQLIDSQPDNETMQNFIAEKIPNTAEFFATQLSIFRNTFLQAVE
jgi:hypothetical protein